MNLESVVCEICGSNRAEALFSDLDRSLGVQGRFTVVRCTECGLLYTNPRPTEEALPACYPHPYKAHGLEGGKAVRQAMYHRRLARYLTCKLPARGRVLDLGCGEGTFLDEFRKLGWDPLGVEMDIGAVEQARAGRGLTAVQSTVQDVNLPAGHFDLITLSHLFEHVPHPRATLRQVRGWLKPGGMLFLALPNQNCWERHLFGRYWMPWGLPRHLYHFDMASLARLLQDEGFQVRDARYLSGLYLLQSLRFFRNRSHPPAEPVNGQLVSRPAGDLREIVKTLLWWSTLKAGAAMGSVIGGELMEVLAGVRGADLR